MISFLCKVRLIFHGFLKISSLDLVILGRNFAKKGK